MRLPLVLAVTLLSVAPALAQEAVLQPQIAQRGGQETAQPAPELVGLDGAFLKAQEDKRQGSIDEKGYQEFLVKFRADLEAAIRRVEPTPVNTALHSRLLSRLGDSGQALAALGSALDQDPESPALRVALSQVLYDRKDYPAALEEAKAVLTRDPMNKAALALKYSSEGRIGTGTGIIPGGGGAEQIRAPLATDSPEAQALAPRIQVARDSGDFRTAMTLAQEIMRAAPTSDYAQEIYRSVAKDHARWQRDQNPRIVGDGKVRRDPETPAPKSGDLPLWPMLPISGLGAAAYVVTKSRRTVESEDGFDEENRPLYGRLQQFVAGAVLAGIAGAGLYLGGTAAVSFGAPFAARFISGPGQQSLRLPQPVAGPINPGRVPLANEVPKVLARVIPLRHGQGEPKMLGLVGDPHVFVTAADDLAGVAPGQIAARLGIAPASRYLIVKFPTPSIGIRTPTQFDNPLFLGRGVTSGGAREFQILNTPIPNSAVKEIVEVSAMIRQQ